MASAGQPHKRPMVVAAIALDRLWEPGRRISSRRQTSSLRDPMIAITWLPSRYTPCETGPVRLKLTSLARTRFCKPATCSSSIPNNAKSSGVWFLKIPAFAFT